MDSEGHLVSMESYFQFDFQLSNESIEHLSNFPYLRNLEVVNDKSNFRNQGDNVTNFSLLSNLRSLKIKYGKEIEDLEFFKDLGLFSNLLKFELENWKYFGNQL